MKGFFIVIPVINCIDSLASITGIINGQRMSIILSLYVHFSDVI